MKASKNYWHHFYKVVASQTIIPKAMASILYIKMYTDTQKSIYLIFNDSIHNSWHVTYYRLASRGWFNICILPLCSVQNLGEFSCMIFLNMRQFNQYVLRLADGLFCWTIAFHKTLRTIFSYTIIHSVLTSKQLSKPRLNFKI